MILTIVIGIIVAVCLVSTLIAYVFMHSRENSKSLNEKQQIKYSLRPSFDVITKRLTNDFTFRSSISSNRSSSTTNSYEENHLNPKRKSIESINPLISPMRSSSMVTNLFQVRRPRSTNWRQGSIVDPNQMALIQFSLPPNNNESKYRRRSVPVCHDIIQSKEKSTITTTLNSKLPCLLSFSITYLKNSQLKIQFHSLQSLPGDIQLQQLTIKMKLIPDGKEKSIQIRKCIQNGTKFGDENNELFLVFSNIHYEKLHEKSLLMTIHGKDQAKKSVHLGQIGKINFNQINQFDHENRVEFLHEIEKIKPVNSNFNLFNILSIFFFSHLLNCLFLLRKMMINIFMSIYNVSKV